tara:strand:- start:3568 stop:4677 length:1110 start_codon:yes stop_codon:yes gene_type:complete
MKYIIYFFLIPFFISCDFSDSEKNLGSEISNESSNKNKIDSVNLNDQNINSLNNYDLNLNNINNYIIQKPESSNGYYKRSIYYKNRKKYQLAIEDINRAITVSPDAAILNYTKAEILYEFAVFNQDVSMIDECKIYLDHCISLDEDFILAKLLKAEILLYSKQTDQAMVLVNDVLKLNSTNAKAYFIKGMIYEHIGNSNLAISSFQTTIEVDPNYYDAYIYLGLQYEKINNQLAIDYYNSAIEINPMALEAFLNKGVFYHFNMKYELARNSFEEVLRIDSTFEVAYFNIGNTFLGQHAIDTVNKMNHISNALKYYNKAISINPNYVQAIHNIGVCKEIIGDKISAKQYYLQSVNLDNNYRPSLDALNKL